MKKIYLILSVLLCIFLLGCDKKTQPVEKETYEIFAHINDEIEFYTVNNGEEFNYIGIVPSGYAIEGWYRDEAFTTSFDTTCVKEDLDIYAKLVKNTCEIVFKDYDGTSFKTINGKLGEYAKEPNIYPSKLYREFTGWCTDEAGTKAYDFTTPLTGDLTLYPGYKEVSYEGTIEKYVPDITSENLSFGADYVDLVYTWESSDPSLIDSVGFYYPSRKEEQVTITLTISCGEESVKYTKTTTVSPYKVRELDLGDLVVCNQSYYYYQGFSDEVLATADIINCCFTYVNSDGTLDFKDFSAFKQVVTICHQNNIRCVMSVQGAESNDGTKGFSDCAADANLRKTLAKSMADAVEYYHFDGIDIDWEYPGSYSKRKSEDKYNYTYLMQEIRTALDALGDDYTLSTSIPGGSWGAGNFELNKVKDIFDFINMMSYDLEGTELVHHHTALYQSDGVTAGASAAAAADMWHNTYGVPYEKILIGCAFYAKPCNATVSSAHPTMLGCMRNNSTSASNKNEKFGLFYEKISTRLGAANSFHYVYDEEACAPYIYSEFGKFLTYDNERSLIAKCEYVKEKGCGGVMIWEIGEDQTSTLITAIAQGMGHHIEGKDYIIAGHQTLSVGQTVNVKTIVEVTESTLMDDCTYSIDNTSIATLNGSALTLNQAGTVVVTAKASDGTIYGTLTITVK